MFVTVSVFVCVFQVCLHRAVTGCVWTRLMLSCQTEVRDVISPTLTQPLAVSRLLLQLNTPVRLVAGALTHLPERYCSQLFPHP